MLRKSLSVFAVFVCSFLVFSISANAGTLISVGTVVNSGIDVSAKRDSIHREFENARHSTREELMKRWICSVWAVSRGVSGVGKIEFSMEEGGENSGNGGLQKILGPSRIATVSNEDGSGWKWTTVESGIPMAQVIYFRTEEKEDQKPVLLFEEWDRDGIPHEKLLYDPEKGTLISMGRCKEDKKFRISNLWR